jgi:hypothetical protein
MIGYRESRAIRTADLRAEAEFLSKSHTNNAEMLLKLLIGGQKNEAQFLITTASYCPRSAVVELDGP